MKMKKQAAIAETPPDDGGGGGGGGGGKTVVVGVRMDEQSRELLTWSLVKVAHPGDRVVALHFVPSSSNAADPTALLSVVKDFESVLAVYEGFCNLKQIDLKLKVCRGSSLRKLLVHEARSLAASALVLGVANPRAHHAIGPSPLSIAKHCAKKLPADCAVVALSSGKIVFQRDSAATHNPKPQKGGDLEGLTAIQAQLSRAAGAADASMNLDCSVCRPGVAKPAANDESPDVVPITVLVPAEGRPGWPLLRDAVLFGKRNAASSPERSMFSMVQWALRLPSRHSVSPTANSHADGKQRKGDVSTNGSPKIDGENPVETDRCAWPPIAPVNEAKLAKELECLKKYLSVCTLYSYQELEQATSSFSPDNLVGKGGSSSVYRGCFSDGKVVAVKILKPSDEAVQEFVSEIEIITTLHHKNIVSLLGFCSENDSLMLVYEFLSMGSLEEVLHGENADKKVLSWPDRYRIATGVAEALEYLHGDGSSQPVIHRDVKSSNILLTDDFEPRLGDFGLSRWASSSSTHITCGDVAGTFGYLAPEYFMYGKVNEKIDVYAFGVVLLELLSGRKPVSTGCPKGQESLVIWAKSILQDQKFKQLLDPKLGEKYDENQMERIVLAASLCIRRAARSRPRIALVLKLLQGDDDALRWARAEVTGSEEFNGWDDETPSPDSNIQSHINLALLDIDDETTSVSSAEPSIDFIAANTSLEEYLQRRCSRSSSFDN